MKKFIEEHFEALMITAVGLLCMAFFAAYGQEHTARVLAEQTVKTAQTQIDSLQKQETAATAAGQKQIVILQKQAATVKTPAQAIQAIPALSDVPLNVRPAPGLPDSVTVDAVALFKELNDCKQDAVNFATCSTQLQDETEIAAAKDIQVKALKKKKSFLARVKKDAIDTAITVGVGMVIGYAAHR